MNQEQPQLVTARDLTRHWESNPMDLPSRIQWFKFFHGENTVFKSTGTRSAQWRFGFGTQDPRAINKLSCPNGP